MAQVFAPWFAIVGVLAGAALLGVAYRYGFGAVVGDGYVRRPGPIGAAGGLAIAAVAVAAFGWTQPAVGVRPAAGLVLLAGLCVHVFAGEYGRYKLREAPADVEAAR